MVWKWGEWIEINRVNISKRKKYQGECGFSRLPTEIIQCHGSNRAVMALTIALIILSAVLGVIAYSVRKSHPSAMVFLAIGAGILAVLFLINIILFFTLG